MATKAEMAVELEALREQVAKLMAAQAAASAPIRPVYDAPQDEVALAKAAETKAWKLLYAKYAATTGLCPVKANVVAWAEREGHRIPGAPAH